MRASIVSDEVVLGQWMRVLFAGLQQGGVQDVIISPGSRSTPLCLEALRDPRFECHSVIDERSAAFFALGIARATGRAPLLICTSGSAGGHYLPALMEAKESELPVIVMTADRPLELMECGAAQTTLQTGMFGKFATDAPAIEEPNAKADKLKGLLRKAAQSVYLAFTPLRGPVHLNIPLPKPLTPHPPNTEAELQLSAHVDDLCSRGAPQLMPSRLLPDSQLLREYIKDVCLNDEPFALTLGPVSHQVASIARKLAVALRAPCFSELPQAGPATPLEFLPTQFAQTPSCRPHRILHIGPPCVSAAWNEYLKNSSLQIDCAPGEKFRDPLQTSTCVLIGNCLDVVRELQQEARHFTPKKGRESYLTKCEALLSRLGTRMNLAGIQSHSVSAEVHEHRHPEITAVQAVLSGVPQDAHLLLANSLSIRLASWCMNGEVSPQVQIHTARGVNGIDGWIASAAGVSRSTLAPTLLIVGDVSAAHDLGSLALAAKAKSPLAICILDNEGGRIFDHLPSKAEFGADSTEWEFFATPPRIDFQAAASTFGIRYMQARTVTDITAVIESALKSEAATLIHLKTNPRCTHQYLELMRSSAHLSS